MVHPSFILLASNTETQEAPLPAGHCSAVAKPMSHFVLHWRPPMITTAASTLLPEMSPMAHPSFILLASNPETQEAPLPAGHCSAVAKSMSHFVLHWRPPMITTAASTLLPEKAPPRFSDRQLQLLQRAHPVPSAHDPIRALPCFPLRCHVFSDRQLPLFHRAHPVPSIGPVLFLTLYKIRNPLVSTISTNHTIGQNRGCVDSHYMTLTGWHAKIYSAHIDVLFCCFSASRTSIRRATWPFWHFCHKKLTTYVELWWPLYLSLNRSFIYVFC